MLRDHIKLFDLFNCIWESETMSAVYWPGYGVGAIGSKTLSGGGSVWIDFTASPKSNRPKSFRNILEFEARAK
jgi:hypothetical protein